MHQPVHGIAAGIDPAIAQRAGHAAPAQLANRHPDLVQHDRGVGLGALAGRHPDPDGVHAGVELVALAHELLRRLRVVPQIRVIDPGVHPASAR